MPSGQVNSKVEEFADSSKAAGSRPARYDRRRPSDPAVSVILPTYNEAENLPILLDRLATILIDIDYEIVIVDDNSPDRTWEIAARYEDSSPRIRSLRRLGERGLSSAVMAGMEVARGRVLAVMDTDLQHDEEALIAIVNPILDGDADVALGSREAEGGSYGEWSKSRRLVSWGGAQMAKRMLGLAVSDPMSGFFAISRERYLAVADQVNPRGFKILLEFLARGEKPRVTEVGYGFRDRVNGATKLTGGVIGNYLVALIDLFAGRLVSATFTAYALVGLMGAVIRFSSLLVMTAFGVQAATLIAFEISVIANYSFNNAFTFAQDRRRGWKAVAGLLPFHMIALHGLMVQAGIAAFAGIETADLWTAPVWVQVVGIGVATTGNFHLNRAITWRRSASVSS